MIEFAKGEFLIGFEDNSFSYVTLWKFVKEQDYKQEVHLNVALQPAESVQDLYYFKDFILILTT